MRKIEGQYGEIYWLKTHLIEAIPKRGVELNARHIEELYTYLTEASRGYCALLINRKNDYSLTFDAHTKVADHSGLIAIAYLTYSVSSAQVAEYTAKLAHYAQCPIKVFMNRDAALSWLKDCLSKYEENVETAGTSKESAVE